MCPPGVWILKKPRIAIVGAGPGGLAFARTLHIHGVDAALFEREQFSSARPQGGSLDMHAESGKYAIAVCGADALSSSASRGMKTRRVASTTSTATCF